AINKGGNLSINNAAISVEGDSSAVMTVDGTATLSDGQLTAVGNSSQVLIGNNGPGALTVANGNLAAYYVIVGANAGADGVWRITVGCNLISGGGFELADSLTATGTAVVTSGQVTVPNAYVGLVGIGRLFVSNGVVHCAGTAVV